LFADLLNCVGIESAKPSKLLAMSSGEFGLAGNLNLIFSSAEIAAWLSIWAASISILKTTGIPEFITPPNPLISGYTPICAVS
jgi:hypothetical protein